MDAVRSMRKLVQNARQQLLKMGNLALQLLNGFLILISDCPRIVIRHDADYATAHRAMNHVQLKPVIAHACEAVAE